MSSKYRLQDDDFDTGSDFNIVFKAKNLLQASHVKYPIERSSSPTPPAEDNLQEAESILNKLMQGRGRKIEEEEEVQEEEDHESNEQKSDLHHQSVSSEVSDLTMTLGEQILSATSLIEQIEPKLKEFDRLLDELRSITQHLKAEQVVKEALTPKRGRAARKNATIHVAEDEIRSMYSEASSISQLAQLAEKPRPSRRSKTRPATTTSGAEPNDEEVAFEKGRRAPRRP